MLCDCSQQKDPKESSPQVIHNKSPHGWCDYTGFVHKDRVFPLLPQAVCGKVDESRFAVALFHVKHCSVPFCAFVAVDSALRPGAPGHRKTGLALDSTLEGEARDSIGVRLCPWSRSGRGY